MKLDKKIMYQY